MKNATTLFLAATFVRLVISFVIFPRNATIDNDNALVRALGPGILPALGAAILDPVHTWDHLEEACFWLENGPTASWRDSQGGGSNARVGYNAIYTPGTRIVAPPLTVAFLGETLVCPPTGSSVLKAIQKLLLLLADFAGAFCIHQVGKRLFELEHRSNEAEIEWHTKLNEMNCGKCNYDLVIPGILRPERGWVFALPSKIIPPEETRDVSKGVLVKDECAKDNQPRGGHKNGKSTNALDTTTSSSLEREPILTMDQLPIVTAILYYCNPISMLANATGSIRSLWDAILLLSFYYTTLPPTRTTKEGIAIKVPSVTKASFTLAVATYADVGYGMFLVPVLLWRGLVRGAQTPSAIGREQHQDWKTMFMLYFFYMGGLHLLASLLVVAESSVYLNVMVRTMLPNLAFVQQDGSGSVPGPSMGLHWYMFVQVFDRFRPYFTVFVSGIPALFIFPLTTRLYRYPLVLAATFQLLWAIFRPTTTVHTLILGLHLAILNPRTIVRMRNPSLVSFFALPVPILLFITFHRMWLVTGNGNPNYIYFQCFAYGLFVTVIMVEFVSATVKRDKVRRMIEKGTIKKLAVEREGTLKGANKATAHLCPTGREQIVTGTKNEKLVGKNDSIEKKDGDAAHCFHQTDDVDSKQEPVVVFL